MARTLTPRDAHALVNLVNAELTGQNASISKVTTDNFVSVGESIGRYAQENVYNALSVVMLRSIIAARVVEDDLIMMEAKDTGVYSSRMRKISYLSRWAKASGDFNTQLYTNLAPGFTAGQNPDSNGDPQSTKSQWEQCPVVPVELHFGGSSVWEHGITWYKDQAKNAFRSEQEYLDFWNGAVLENSNDIIREKNAYRRVILLNFLAGLYDLQASGTCAVNLTKEFNDTYGTNYTSAQLRTTYRKDFLEFFVETFKTYSENLKKSSMNYHVNISKTINGETYNLLRGTPFNRQRAILYKPLFIKAEATVLPEIFNPQYLDLETSYQPVMWWQNENNPSAIDVVPSLPDFANTGLQLTGDRVQLDYVVGVLYDQDAMMSNFQLDDANTTNLEARKRFRNTWYSMARNGINDFTEKAVLFYMKDEVVPPVSQVSVVPVGG